MRDKTPDTYKQDLPPCSLSVHCQRWFDVLDGYHAKGNVYWDQGPLAENRHDEQLIELLHRHVPTCPTCRAALEEARQMRSLQRNMLREVLTEGEQLVPSTVEQILRAMQSDQQVPHKKSAGPVGRRVSHGPPALLPEGSLLPLQIQRNEQRPRILFRTLCSLVAAAIILASLSIFLHFIWLEPASDRLAASSSLTFSSRWSSVVMTTIQDGNQAISLYDPQTSKSVVLVASTSHSLSSVSITPTGVSHDGKKILYSSFDGKQTTYYLRSLTSTTPLFTINGDKSYVVWSTDDRDIFVSTPQGIENIDVQSKAEGHILPALKFVNLQYYRDGYLYYIDSQDGLTGILNRVDIAHGNVQSVTGTCADGSRFWQSPEGIPVYYVCEKPQDGLFVVNSDGTKPHLLRTQAGPMIGYAADGSPLTLADTAGKYQVVKLGTDKHQDQVILDDVVPGGSIISADDTAVAPFGYTLVARAIYDDYEAIWYGDLTSGEKHLSMKVGKDTQVEFYGWSRILVP